MVGDIRAPDQGGFCSTVWTVVMLPHVVQLLAGAFLAGVSAVVYHGALLLSQKVLVARLADSI